LVRALPLQGRCRGFESLHAHAIAPLLLYCLFHVAALIARFARRTDPTDQNYHSSVATSRPSQWVIRHWSTTSARVRTVLLLGAAIVLIAGLAYEVRSIQRGYYQTHFGSARIVSLTDSEVCAQTRTSVHCVDRDDIEGSEPSSVAVGDCLSWETSMVDYDEIRKVGWGPPNFTGTC